MQKRWIEALGALLLIIAGLLFLLVNVGLLPEIQAVVWAGLFVAGGAIFLAGYAMDRSQWWPLIPGFALVGVGATIFLGDALPAYAELAGVVLFVSLALAFGAVYLTERRENWWALIPGGVMVALALLVLLGSAAGEWAAAVFFLGLGAVFVAVYFAEIDGQRHHWWALIPAGALISLAAVVVFSTLGQDALAGGALFLGLGLTFGVLYLIRSEERSLGWAWIPSVALIGFGIVVLALAADSLYAQLFWPVAIIIAGLVLLFVTLRNRARRLE